MTCGKVDKKKGRADALKIYTVSARPFFLPCSAQESRHFERSEKSVVFFSL